MAIYILACSAAVGPPGTITITTNVRVDTPTPRRVTMRYSLGGGVPYDFCPAREASRGPRELGAATDVIVDTMSICPSPPPAQTGNHPISVKAQQIGDNGAVIDETPFFVAYFYASIA